MGAGLHPERAFTNSGCSNPESRISRKSNGFSRGCDAGALHNFNANQAAAWATTTITATKASPWSLVVCVEPLRRFDFLC
jgi:hypothetical protein